MKKTISLILAAVVLAAGFTACQKKEDPAGSSAPSSFQNDVTQAPGSSNTTQAETHNAEGTTKKTEPVTVNQTAAEAMKPNGKKYVSVTFDDGPGPYTDDLLDGLKERGVKAAFFMLGSQVKQYPKTVKRIAEEGHMVGSHTYDHKDIKKMTDAQVKKELDDTDAAIRKAAGVTASALRPPYGSYTKTQVKKINKMIVLWDVDPNDWKDRNAQTVCDRILKEVKNGSIILSHDIYKTSVQGVLKAIDVLQKQGYVFVRPDELVQRSGAPVLLGKAYYDAYPSAAPKTTAPATGKAA